MSALPSTPEGTGRRRVVVIGSGFGGLTATRALRHAPVDVTERQARAQRPGEQPTQTDSAAMAA